MLMSSYLTHQFFKARSILGPVDASGPRLNTFFRLLRPDGELVELRLEAFSYYALPTRIFFNATYGFDQFERYLSSVSTTVTYGKEWNFHFGVLFGFDLD